MSDDAASLFISQSKNKGKDRPARISYVAFVVASHYRLPHKGVGDFLFLKEMLFLEP